MFLSDGVINSFPLHFALVLSEEVKHVIDMRYARLLWREPQPVCEKKPMEHWSDLTSVGEMILLVSLDRMWFQFGDSIDE